MNDRPTARELIEAVRGYLEQELLPGLTDARQRYQTLIAANVLAIAGRELDTEAALRAEEKAWLTGLLGASGEVNALTVKLCDEIRRGAFDQPQRFAEALAVVRKIVVRKLEVANPRHLANLTARSS